MKHTVAYTEKNERTVLVEKIKTFDSVQAACSFFREIKSKSITVPVMDTIENGAIYIERVTS